MDIPFAILALCMGNPPNTTCQWYRALIVSLLRDWICFRTLKVDYQIIFLHPDDPNTSYFNQVFCKILHGSNKMKRWLTWALRKHILLLYIETHFVINFQWFVILEQFLQWAKLQYNSIIQFLKQFCHLDVWITGNNINMLEILKHMGMFFMQMDTLDEKNKTVEISSPNI